MAKWAEIKCPRCEELEDKLNYAVGEWRDYEKTIEQMEAERLAKRVAIMRFEVKLAKAVGALGDIYDGEPEWPDDPEKELEWCRNRAKRTLAELTGGKDE